MPKPILLIEDNAMDVELTKRAFRKNGSRNPIELARDGEEAIGWMVRWDDGEPRPVFILLDLNLPKVHGLLVLKALKTHPVYRVIPVVVLTTSTEEVDLYAAYQGGANSYIVKPMQFEKFVEVTGTLRTYWTEVNAPYGAK